MRIVIKFRNQPVEGILYKIARFAFIQHFSKCNKFCLLFLKQPQTCTHNLTGRRKSSVFQLVINKRVKVFIKGNARVLAHLLSLRLIPIFGTIVRHNKGVKPLVALARTLRSYAAPCLLPQRSAANNQFIKSH
ncbi:hypothetical protein A3194_00385 [Candidatus Thiodiazotropha endoloripes]|uniref:Uncharacterized protein n=1 Tax=Candidatus Thiodiazotropha endoloripes TaxID=1818881 RepID=A0A1E2UNF0_9GAMM|nr:hypothetical protein A3194_00385 [Candidatus Thiodiazotropha endoloripes]ODB96270.1 hypothetical protein A3196_05525 [Candidatus Thiodiazotropha endoloripes]